METGPLYKIHALKLFRERYKLTQAKAAKLLGYTYSAFVSYEKGNRPIPEHIIKHITLYESYVDPD